MNVGRERRGVHVQGYLRDAEEDLLEVSVAKLSLELVADWALAEELPRLCLTLGLPPLGC